MLNILHSTEALGLEVTSKQIKAATLFFEGHCLKIKNLSTLTQPYQIEDVKQLYSRDPILSTAIEGNEVLVRFIHLPVTKTKDLDAALFFQADTILPYPVEDAFLEKQVLAQNSEGTDLTILSVRKESVDSHIKLYDEIGIIPEVISCVPEALAQFAAHFMEEENPFFILHCGDKYMTSVLVRKGKIIASLTSVEGLELLSKAMEEDKLFSGFDFFSVDPEKHPHVEQAIKKLQQGFVKINYALSKSLEGESPAGILFTGDLLNFANLDAILAERVTLRLLESKKGDFSSQEQQCYAVSIGLAAGALREEEERINFRKADFAYPNPWKRLIKPITFYFSFMIFFSIVFYMFGQLYLKNGRTELKQEYVDLLSAMNKPYNTFEGTFLTKNPLAAEKSHGEVIPIDQLTEQDLADRIDFLQKDLLATPDSFPLFPNIPRVTDVLTWLSTHENVIEMGEESDKKPKLQLENFSYVLVKRPMQGKKQEKYQVKVELEFSSPTPKWAREFHDALIAPNKMVDPKGEIKWSTNRGKYKTSFFLKDKTNYQTQ